MSSNAGDGQAAPDPGGTGAGYEQPPTMGDLRTMVADVVKDQIAPFLEKISGGGKPDPAPSSSSAAAPAAGADPAGLASAVDAAVAKVLGDRDQQSEADAHRKQHEQLAAAAERPPVPRSKRARWLGDIYDREQ